MTKKLKQTYCMFLSVLMVFTMIFTSHPIVADAYTYPTPEAETLFIKKLIKGTNNYLPDAKLTLYKGEDKSSEVTSWTTTSDKYEVPLNTLENNTTYVLSETTPPQMGTTQLTI